MPVYEFQNPYDKTRIERFYPASRAPDVGETITEDGKAYTRIVSTPQVSGFVSYVNQYPKTSSTLPKWCDGAEHVQSGREVGKPIITSHTHEKELCKQYGYTRDY